MTMRRLFRHADPDGATVEVLAMRGRTFGLVLAATEDGENAMVNLPRERVAELHEALGQWLEAGS